MYGEDCSGRRVSLLNDDTSISHTTTTITAAPFTRPKLPERSQCSNSSSSVTSYCSRDSYRSSRPSSISCSPRHSPPTPPLVRLDSQSSVSTQSPMTPPFNYDPMDQRNLYKNGQPPQQGFFVNAYPGPHAAGGSNAYPPMHDPAPQAFYPMSAQQPLPPVYDLNESFTQQATLNPLQTAAIPQYAVNPALNPLSPTHNASILPSPSTALPTTITPKTTNVSTTVSTAPLSANSTTAFSASATSPVKTDPSTPITSNKASSKSSNNNNNNNNNNATQPKKKYPCPHAKSAGCKDTFTTSGHAARHGKKHTGEKNVACPTCGKTFTRKDNMKQHERTHKNQGAGVVAISRTTADSMATSPILTSNSLSRRGRAVSSSTIGSGSSMKDIDNDGIIMMETDLDPQQAATAGGRPEIKRSKLSEILEQAKQDGELDAEGEIDPDAEGESPALDALATVAAGEIVQ